MVPSGQPLNRIAQLIGADPTHFSRALNGQEAFTEQERQKLAEVLQFPEDWLFFGISKTRLPRGRLFREGEEAQPREPGPPPSSDPPGDEPKFSAQTLQRIAEAEKRFPPALVPAFREKLPEECREMSFDVLVQAGSNALQLVLYLHDLSCTYRYHEELQKDSPRMTRDQMRSLVERTCRVAEEWEELLHSPFGEVILAEARRSDPLSTPEEFLNTPPRNLALARALNNIHGGTASKRRPMYDDTLAELLCYIQIATKKQHLKEASILVGHFTDRPYYAFNELSSWKVDHKEELRRAYLRLTGKC
jgi:transcriptional regulator with XRE-family HTH domain